MPTRPVPSNASASLHLMWSGQRALEYELAVDSELAIKAALTLYSKGVCFHHAEGSSHRSAVRMPVRTVYMQQIAGEAAPYNRELEATLQSDWLAALNGDASKFLNHRLTEAMGSHDPVRLTYWQQRKDELSEIGAEAWAKLIRRNSWCRLARQPIERHCPLPPAPHPFERTFQEY